MCRLLQILKNYKHVTIIAYIDKLTCKDLAHSMYNAYFTNQQSINSMCDAFARNWGLRGW